MASRRYSEVSTRAACEPFDDPMLTLLRLGWIKARLNLNGLPAELLSGRIPPHWVDGIARLESHRVPKEVPAHRWRQFINDCHTFLMAKENWAERAAGLGWDDLELFGCCRRPLERLGSAGLLWAINGGRLVELRRDWAVIERTSDRSRHVHYRERPKAANITLPWIGLR
jgi:hypothetical protein